MAYWEIESNRGGYVYKYSSLFCVKCVPLRSQQIVFSQTAQIKIQWFGRMSFEWKKNEFFTTLYNESSVHAKNIHKTFFP